MDVCLFTVAIVVPGMMVVSVWFAIDNRERRRRFLRRAPMEPDAWFDAYLPWAGAHQRDVIDFLIILEEYLGFSWTLLRLHDTFSGTLRLRSRSLTEDEQETWGDMVEIWWAERRLSDPPRFPDDLGGVLAIVVQHLRLCDGRDTGSEQQCDRP